MKDKQFAIRYAIYEPNYKKYYWHDVYSGVIHKWYDDAINADLHKSKEIAEEFLTIIKNKYPQAYVVAIKFVMEDINFLA